MAQGANYPIENIPLSNVPSATAPNPTSSTSDHDEFSDLQADFCLRWLSRSRYHSGDEYTVE